MNSIICLKIKKQNSKMPNIYKELFLWETITQRNDIKTRNLYVNDLYYWVIYSIYKVCLMKICDNFKLLFNSETKSVKKNPAFNSW